MSKPAVSKASLTTNLISLILENLGITILFAKFLPDVVDD
jgi:hypothetical protein